MRIGSHSTYDVILKTFCQVTVYIHIVWLATRPDAQVYSEKSLQYRLKGSRACSKGDIDPISMF